MLSAKSRPLDISVRTLWTHSASVPRPALDFCDRLLCLDKLQALYQSTRDPGAGAFSRRLLEHLNVACDVDDEDLAHIPVSGPVLVVANHPHGLLDGALLTATVSQVRSDMKILTNGLLASLQGMEEHCIFIDPFGGPGATRRNQRSLREAIAWLSAGKLLIMFPAGEVSHWQFESRTVTDPRWCDTAARLLRTTRAAIVPAFLTGENGAAFQILGLLHPRLRTAALPAELFNKQGKRLSIKIGKPVPSDTLDRILTAREVTQYLRYRTYLLGERGRARIETAQRLESFSARLVLHLRPKNPIADPVPSTVLAEEIARLRPEKCMARSEHFSVFLASASEIPKSLQEIGRLRETTFRAAGEGSGRALDLDGFDYQYEHLFAWNEQTREIVGAYRLCRADRVIRERGFSGVYTHTLFDFGPELIRNFGPCIELGRSFVRREYQRQFTPLLLLWRGIGRYIALHPEIAILFGAVSISSDYNQLSRQLIADFFLKQPGDELTGLVRPRRPLRSHHPDQAAYRSLVSLFRNLDDLSAVVGDVEGNNRNIPVLVRQYARLGGRMLAFNVDPNFSDALDGFVVVDLRRTESKLLERYLGRENAAEFLRAHPWRAEIVS